MTRPTAAGRVNRRFLFLALILAGLSAVLVYALLSRSDSGGGAPAGETVSVVVATTDIRAGSTLTGDMVDVASVPANLVGAQPFRTTDAVIGEVLRYPVKANEQILASKVVGTGDVSGNDVLSHIIEPGKRGLGVKVEAVVNGGGLILPGDHVDVLWVPEVVLNDDQFEGAGLIAENVEVLAVQQTLVDLPASAPGAIGEESPTPVADERVRASESEPIPDALTVTLLLTPEQSARIFCADAGADSSPQGDIRLAVRAFGDDSPSGLPPLLCVLGAGDDG